MLLIGSRALSKFHKLSRKPKDYDFIGTSEEVYFFIKKNNIEIYSNKHSEHQHTISGKKGDINYDFEIAKDDLSSVDYIKYCNNIEGEINTAPAYVLYSIKKSHIHIPNNFKKHILDYHYMKSFLGTDQLEEITKKRKIEHSKHLKLKTANLNQTVEDFVSESQSKVKRIYDHDDLHRIVSIDGTPMYTKIQTDSKKVWCSQKLWEELDYNSKLRMVQEESYVIALERFIIPMIFQKGKLITTKKAFEVALEKVSTTLSSGFFRDFALENHIKIISTYDSSYHSKFLKEYENNTVKLNEIH